MCGDDVQQGLHPGRRQADPGRQPGDQRDRVDRAPVELRPVAPGTEVWNTCAASSTAVERSGARSGQACPTRAGGSQRNNTPPRSATTAPAATRSATP